MNNLLIPGMKALDKYTLRSLDFVRQMATLESLESKPWRPEYCTMPFSMLKDHIDTGYAKRVLSSQLAWVRTRTTGRAKVSKRTLERLEAQFKAI